MNAAVGVGGSASSEPMRIAFVSYEYAGISQGGGIATYVRNAAAMLTARGHAVEVFTSSEGGVVNGRTDTGVQLWAVDGRREAFAQAVLPVFLARHRELPFEVVEGAEYGADLEAVQSALPGLPRVVKLATASYQINAINDTYLTPASKLRFLAGGLRRGQWPRPFWGRYDAATDAERAMTLSADVVTSPSAALLDATRLRWPIGPGRSYIVPYVFQARQELLSLSPNRPSSLVTFIGKLEVRKGVLELARAIPSILRAVPDARFRFVGRTLLHPGTREPLDFAVRRLAGKAAADRIEFTGAVPYDRIPELLADTAVGVFPSYWEAFGFVCLEAMAAGCGVVGSSAGGMSEIIDHGRNGLLVPPRSPRAIANAVIALLEDPAQRARMGEAARAHVLAAYSEAAIGPLQEESYRRAIEQARGRASTMIRDR